MLRSVFINVPYLKSSRTVFVVIVASDNIAEQVAFTPKDPRLDQTNHLGKERISRAGK